MWPDVRLKSSPIFPKSCQKVATSDCTCKSFCFRCHITSHSNYPHVPWMGQVDGILLLVTLWSGLLAKPFWLRNYVFKSAKNYSIFNILGKFCKKNWLIWSHWLEQKDPDLSVQSCDLSPMLSRIKIFVWKMSERPERPIRNGSAYRAAQGTDAVKFILP